MNSHEHKTYTWTQAVGIVSCSPSTLRRRLNAEGPNLGATKLKRGWIIPHTTLEAMGLIRTVNTSETVHVNSSEQSNEHNESEELKEENNRLRIENARLRERTEQQEQRIGDLQHQISDQRANLKLIEAKQGAESGHQFRSKTSFWHRLFR